jgi:ABC-2 type transport system permease protein
MLFGVSALTFIFPVLLNQFVEPGIDQGPIVSGYLGIMLLCAALVAVGVAISSLFSNQIAAFGATMLAVVFLWWIIGPIAQVLGPVSGSSELISYLNFQDHFFSNLVRGVIDLSDVLYYLSITALSLFLGSVVVEMRRWR